MQIKVSEVFGSIQGEGYHVGTPVLFIRLSGCTRECPFCDSAYHTVGTLYDVEVIAKQITDSGFQVVVFTGGEPLIQLDALLCLRLMLPETVSFHLESNGDYIYDEDDAQEVFDIFNFLCFSPKEVAVAEKLKKFFTVIGSPVLQKVELKIVTDLQTVGKDMLKFATTLMPLSTYDAEIDVVIRRKVWEYCVRHQLRYSPRLHIDLFGKKRKV